MSDVRHPYLVVIGRLSGDDEDTLLSLQNMTREEASEAFEAHIVSDSGARSLAELQEGNEDACVYVNQILTASTEITITNLSFS